MRFLSLADALPASFRLKAGRRGPLDPGENSSRRSLALLWRHRTSRITVLQSGLTISEKARVFEVERVVRNTLDFP